MKGSLYILVKEIPVLSETIIIFKSQFRIKEATTPNPSLLRRGKKASVIFPLLSKEGLGVVASFTGMTSKIFFLIFCLFMLSSCSDVINSDENLNKILLNDQIAADDSLKNLSFNKIDSNNYSSSYIFDLTNSKYPVRKELKLTLFNKSNIDTIMLYSLNYKYNNQGFYIRYSHNLPIKIFPNSFIDSANTIFIGIAIDNSKKQFLLDSLIFNNSERFRASILALLRN